jgi:ribonuclease BN (tRNA processing enzyme)
MRNNQRSSNYDWERDWDFDERFGANFQLQTGVDYTMTESGELVDASQRTTTDNTDTYRYKGDSLDNQIQELQRQRDEENRRRDEEIERQRQRVEEENRRLQELQNTSTTENTSRVIRRNKPAIETTGIHTPIFSLII